MSGPTIQDVFHAHYDDYCKRYRPSPQQAKTAYHIMNCKTGAFGSNVSVCTDCGHVEYHHNSCRNRVCPMCQEIPRAKWVDAQKENLLDAPYFHVVFTVPEELNALIYSNQKGLYSVFYKAAAETLDELALDPKHLGAKIGFLSVLHTWGGSMNYHPHLHVVVLGGGLDADGHWKPRGGPFFLPIHVISKVFRGKYMFYLKRLWESKKLEFHGNAEKYRNRYEFQDLVDACYGKEWIPYCKKTFDNAEAVIEYLGRYTHRIAISNSRILRMDGDNVTYRSKDYKNAGVWKEVTVSGVGFIRLFLMHVLPKRFVRIRHYGLLANRCKREKMTLCRNLLGCRKYISELKGKSMPEILLKLFGIDLRICPGCGSVNYWSQKRLMPSIRLNGT